MHDAGSYAQVLSRLTQHTCNTLALGARCCMIEALNGPPTPSYTTSTPWGYSLDNTSPTSCTPNTTGHCVGLQSGLHQQQKTSSTGSFKLDNWNHRPAPRSGANCTGCCDCICMRWRLAAPDSTAISLMGLQHDMYYLANIHAASWVRYIMNTGSGCTCNHNFLGDASARLHTWKG